MKKSFVYLFIVLLFILLIPINNVKAQVSIPIIKNNIKQQVPYLVTVGVVKVKENIYIQPEQVEDSDVISIGSDIYVNGTVNGDVTSIGGNVYINGKVRGDATALGGRVIKGPKGSIKGEMKERFKNFKIPFIDKNKNIEGINFKYSRIASAILLAILCIIVYNLIPYNEMRMASSINIELGKNLLYGYVFMFLTPIVIITLLFSIVGIIIVPLVIIAFLATFLIGFTALSLYVGKRFLKSRFSPMTSILVGVVFYEIIKSVVFLGLGSAIIGFFIFPLSIGIAIRSKFGSFRPWRRMNTHDDWNNFWQH